MSRLSSTTRSPDRSASNEARARSIRLHLSGGGGRRRRARQLRLGEHRFDLRIGAVGGDGRVERALAVGRFERRIEIDVAARAFADQHRPGQVEARGNRLADRRGSEVAAGARGVGDAVQAEPLGHVSPP